MPITQHDLRLYESFHGDADGFALSTPGPTDRAGASDWQAIDEVVTKLRLAATVPVSDSFRREAELRLAELAGGSSELECELRRLAEASKSW
jgi:hypothetical protein